MYVKDVTYEDFNGKIITETLYFHLNAPEVVQLDAQFGVGGLEGAITKLEEDKNPTDAINFFELLIQASYGQKSEDGKQFKKKGLELFIESAAYNQLFMDLLTEENAGVEFFSGVIPNMPTQLQEAANNAAVVKHLRKIPTKG